MRQQGPQQAEPQAQDQPQQGQAQPQPRQVPGPQPRPEPQDIPADAGANPVSPWFAAPQVVADGVYEGTYNPAYGDDALEPGAVTVPYGAGNRTRPLGGAPGSLQGQRREGPYQVPVPEQRNYVEAGDEGQLPPEAGQGDVPMPPGQESDELPIPGLPDDLSRNEAYFNAFRKYVSEHQDFPNARQFGLYLMDLYGITGRTGGPLTEGSLRGYLRDFKVRFQREMDAAENEHIA
jgi:hypothetical protein